MVLCALPGALCGHVSPLSIDFVPGAPLTRPATYIKGPDREASVSSLPSAARLSPSLSLDQHALAMSSTHKLFAPDFPYDLQRLRELIDHGQPLRDDIDCPTRVVHIDGGMVVKYGDSVRVSEALAMDLVRTQTSIPAPRVLAYFRESTEIVPHGVGYIVMEHVCGVMLSEVLDVLDDDVIQKITWNFSTYVSEMKKLDKPEEWGMVGKDGVYHRGPYFSYQSPRSFATEPHASTPLRAKSCQDFLEYFAHTVDRSKNDDWAAETQFIVDAFDNTRPSSFSHPDLTPENILVDPNDGRITGILDWHGAGWYPYFWMSWVARNRQGSYSHVQYLKWHRIWTAAMKEYTESVGFGTLLFEAEAYGVEECTGSM